MYNGQVTLYRVDAMKPLDVTAVAMPYEARLRDRTEFLMEETGRFFGGSSNVHKALQRITSKLQSLDIPYVVVGGLAMNAHGYIRMTEDVDLLVTPEDLRRVHSSLSGLGYVPPFEGSKHLRDVTEGVKIEFLTTGGFPGDGKPKPVSFPDPREVGVELYGMRVISLPRLVELKLASGMSNAQRLKDLSDVQELSREVGLDEAFAEQLDPSVRGKFLELIQPASNEPKDFDRW